MAKKKAMKKEAKCDVSGGNCGCNFVMAAAVIVIIWVWPAELWSQIVITALAALMGFGHKCYNKK